MDISSEPVTTREELSEDAYVSWHRLVEPRLRAALVAEFGADLGRDATSEALSYVWENRLRVLGLDNSVATRSEWGNGGRDGSERIHGVPSWSTQRRPRHRVSSRSFTRRWPRCRLGNARSSCCVPAMASRTPKWRRCWASLGVQCKTTSNEDFDIYERRSDHERTR
jgi:hypothetical protein